jgi:hypothetical protein
LFEVGDVVDLYLYFVIAQFLGFADNHRLHCFFGQCLGLLYEVSHVLDLDLCEVAVPIF